MSLAALAAFCCEHRSPHGKRQETTTFIGEISLCNSRVSYLYILTKNDVISYILSTAHHKSRSCVGLHQGFTPVTYVVLFSHRPFAKTTTDNVTIMADDKV